MLTIAVRERKEELLVNTANKRENDVDADEMSGEEIT